MCKVDEIKEWAEQSEATFHAFVEIIYSDKIIPISVNLRVAFPSVWFCMCAHITHI
jgi:hypothetical protein